MRSFKAVRSLNWEFEPTRWCYRRKLSEIQALTPARLLSAPVHFLAYMQCGDGLWLVESQHCHQWAYFHQQARVLTSCLSTLYAFGPSLRDDQYPVFIGLPVVL